MSELFYLQDNRSYVGNDILWWAKDGKGYTTDLTKAHIFSKEEALKQNQCRETDIPWPKNYIDKRTRPAVDMQYVDIETALQGSGIKLAEPPKYERPRYRCHECGVYISEATYYAGECPRCGAYNRP